MFVALATVCTWVLSLDTTAVLLTPIGLVVASELGISPLPFAFASIWLANAASMLLPVSNLTNLLVQDKLGLATTDFMALTWRPQLAIMVVVTGCWCCGTGDR
jgi:arsenical pump membrane protein